MCVLCVVVFASRPVVERVQNVFFFFDCCEQRSQPRLTGDTQEIFLRRRMFVSPARGSCSLWSGLFTSVCNLIYLSNALDSKDEAHFLLPSFFESLSGQPLRSVCQTHELPNDYSRYPVTTALPRRWMRVSTAPFARPASTPTRRPPLSLHTTRRAPVPGTRRREKLLLPQTICSSTRWRVPSRLTSGEFFHAFVTCGGGPNGKEL